MPPGVRPSQPSDDAQAQNVRLACLVQAQMPPNAYDNMSQEERHRIKARVLSWQ
jgi:hypothetical protein